MARRRTLALLRIAYLVAAATLLVWLIARRREAIADLLRGTRPGWLLLSLAMSFGMLGLAALVWHRLLRAQGEQVRRVTVVHATARAVLARYVPGSIWFAVGRATLLGRAGVAAGPLTVTAATEIVLSVVTTIAGGALILGLAGTFPAGQIWAIGAAVVLAAAASPAVAGRAIQVIAARRGAVMPVLGWPAYLGAAGLTAAFWAYSAVTFTVYLRAFPVAGGIDLVTIVGGFLFSWGIGFLAVVAPQGVGVFELTLATILVNEGIGETALVIGGYRVVILVRDAIATALAELTATDRLRGDRSPDPS